MTLKISVTLKTIEYFIQTHNGSPEEMFTHLSAQSIASI